MAIKDENVTENVTEDAVEKKEKKSKKADKSAEELIKLQEEYAALNDRYMRTLAEYDNFRRRSREEKDALYDSAVADTVLELLPIIDNLERAAAYDEGEKIKDGLVMTAKSVDSVFAKLKIEAVGAPGDKFDPNLHNAVLHDENPDLGEGEITDVFQKGYKKGSKMIRFAMVKTVN